MGHTGEYGDLTAIDLSNHKYSFKTQLYYEYHSDDKNNGYVYSYSSNTLTMGKNSMSEETSGWSNASAWASSTLQRAVDAGLLSRILRGADGRHAV